MSNQRDEADDRFALRGENPDAYMFRFAAGLSDYDPEERPQTTGVMRMVGLSVFVICTALVGLGFLLL